VGDDAQIRTNGGGDLHGDWEFLGGLADLGLRRVVEAASDGEGAALDGRSGAIKEDQASAEHSQSLPRKGRRHAPPSTSRGGCGRSKGALHSPCKPIHQTPLWWTKQGQLRATSTSLDQQRSCWRQQPPLRRKPGTYSRRRDF
jgi:hypothetical protein